MSSSDYPTLPEPDLSRSFWTPPVPKEGRFLVRKHPVLKPGDLNPDGTYVWQERKGDFFPGSSTQNHRTRESGYQGMYYGLVNPIRCNHCEENDRFCSATLMEKGKSRTCAACSLRRCDFCSFARGGREELELEMAHHDSSRKRGLDPKFDGDYQPALKRFRSIPEDEIDTDTGDHLIGQQDVQSTFEGLSNKLPARNIQAFTSFNEKLPQAQGSSSHVVRQPGRHEAVVVDLASLSESEGDLTIATRPKKRTRRSRLPSSSDDGEISANDHTIEIPQNGLQRQGSSTIQQPASCGQTADDQEAGIPKPPDKQDLPNGWIDVLHGISSSINTLLAHDKVLTRANLDNSNLLSRLVSRIDELDARTQQKQQQQRGEPTATDREHTRHGGWEHECLSAVKKLQDDNINFKNYSRRKWQTIEEVQEKVTGLGEETERTKQETAELGKRTERQDRQIHGLITRVNAIEGTKRNEGEDREGRAKRKEQEKRGKRR